MNFSTGSGCVSGDIKTFRPHSLSESVVKESVQWIEEIIEYYGGVMSLALLQQVLFRVDRSFFCSLFDSFSGLQPFLLMFPNRFSIAKQGDRVFVQLLQRPVVVQDSSVGNSTGEEFYRDSNVGFGGVFHLGHHFVCALL